jgi:hypothetical protein
MQVTQIHFPAPLLHELSSSDRDASGDRESLDLFGRRHPLLAAIFSVESHRNLKALDFVGDSYSLLSDLSLFPLKALIERAKLSEPLLHALNDLGDVHGW